MPVEELAMDVMPAGDGHFLALWARKSDISAAITRFREAGIEPQVVSSLPSASPSLSLPSIPPGLLGRLGDLHLDLNTGPIAKFFEKLAHEGTDEAKKILKIADQVADFLHLDDTLLDSLLARLGVADSDA